MSKIKNSLVKIMLAGYIVGLVPAASIAQASPTSFSDVNSETNYSEAITYLKDHNIVQGYADGSFGPSKNINRAEFTKILVGALDDVKPEGKDCFPDVKNEWYAPYVCTAKKLNFVSGYADGTFKPEEPINFSEAAKIIATTFSLNQGEKDASVWFKQYIEALQKDNAIPLSVEYFDEKITRDEMSEIIWRVKADIKDKSSRTYAELNGNGLTQAQSCEDIEQRYEELTPRGPIYYTDIMREDIAPDKASSNMPAPAMDSSNPTVTGSAGAATDYSHTNLQNENVDEADVIKNDGKYIYMIKGNTVRIVQAYPANTMKELINFQLGPQDQNFYPTDMYVTGDKLVVMGTSSSYPSYPVMPLDAVSTSSSGTTVSSTPTTIAEPTSSIAVPDSKMGIWAGVSRTKVYIVDISNRSKPKVVRTVDFDGNYQTSRRVGSTLYLVANKYPYYPYYTGTKPTKADYTNFFPTMSDSKDGGKDQLVVPCTAIRIMPKPKTFNFLITAAIPLDDLTKNVSRSVIVGNSENVYASDSNLYIASSDWSGPYYYSQNSNTKIYKYSLANGQIDFVAEGLVPGTILNQFSMDEFRGNFRIATTENNYTSEGEQSSASNNLFVLDSNLKTVGKIQNLAKGEQLYAVRFTGDRAYLVSFKYVDPLFVLDLADAKNPKVLGELKIPGYSDYLQPYDDTHVIGFGKDVDPAEVAKDQSYVYYTAVRGFKMGLFDVKDPTKPKQLFTETIGDQGTYSELLDNHKALLFDKTKNLIAFPITVTKLPEEQKICSNYTFSTCPSTCTAVCTPKCTYENGITTCDNTCDAVNSCQNSGYSYPKTIFSGAYVYGLDLTKGFQLKAKISHLNDKEQAYLETNGYLENYEQTIQRIIYIGDTLYTISQAAIKANSLTDSFRELNMIQLAGSIYNLTYGKTPELAQ